ncbi:MAG: hypothetical protein U5N55_02515 [Cypionkella sp.]|nr:hypothetical protein [Cypionkella sp.]
MHEDFWFVKAALVGVCLIAIIYDMLTPNSFAAEAVLGLAMIRSLP